MTPRPCTQTGQISSTPAHRGIDLAHREVPSGYAHRCDCPWRCRPVLLRHGDVAREETAVDIRYSIGRRRPVYDTHRRCAERPHVDILVSVFKDIMVITSFYRN